MLSSSLLIIIYKSEALNCGVAESGLSSGSLILTVIGIRKSTPIRIASPSQRAGKNEIIPLLADKQACEVDSLS